MTEMITREAAISQGSPQKGNGQTDWPDTTMATDGPGYLYVRIEHDLERDYPHGPSAASERRYFTPARGLYVPSREASAESRDSLNRAFELIVDAADDEYGEVERSNYFDDWKKYLVVLSKKAGHFDSKHRQLLGALIASTKGKDVCDFDGTILTTFREITNKLRVQTVTKKDVRSSLSRLLKLGLSITIPLATEGVDQKKYEELESMMDRLIDKSRI